MSKLSSIINKGFLQSLFFRDRFVLINFVLSIFLNIVAWIVLYLKFMSVYGDIPLHYNIYFGIDYFGPAENIFVISFAGLIIVVVNFFLSHLLIRKSKLLSYFLAATSSFYQLILFLATLLIINLKN